MRDKLYVALCGLPDCGKSTFIKHYVKQLTGRDVSVDSLCDEEKKEMTIRSAQIISRMKDSDYDVVFLDCPGHLELVDEIKSCLSKADVVLNIHNCKDFIDDTENYKWKIIDLIHNKEKDTIWSKVKAAPKIIEVYSHCSNNNDAKLLAYDVDNLEQAKITFNRIASQLDEVARKLQASELLVNPLSTAVRVVAQAVLYAKKPAAMVSYGKDSLVMMAIAKALNLQHQIKWFYPVSGFDLPGISKEFIDKVNQFFGVVPEPFRVIPDDPEWTFEKKTVQEMMLKKAEMLNQFIAKQGFDYVFTGIRRDEEGVRAKEKFFSVRANDGSANLYEQQYEPFFNELEPVLKSGVDFNTHHIRVHPLLDVTEADAWIFTRDQNLPFCSEYVATEDCKRYRSLGDKQITTPITSNARTIDEIVAEVTWTLLPERACRAAQDNAVKGNMETIRSKGFF